MVIVRWTREAEIWLKGIHDYIAKDSPAAAESVIQGIHDKSQILEQYPNIGYRFKLQPDGEIRILLYGHYRHLQT